MKNRNPLIIVAAPFLIASMLMCDGGCSTFDTLFDRTVTEVPGQIIVTNTVFKTNVVFIAAVTNAATGDVTQPQIKQVITPEISYVFSPPTYVTNIAPRASIQGAIQGAGGLPLPYAGTAAVLIGWAYSAYAALRNRKINKALVLSVQAGRQFLTETPEGRTVADGFKKKMVESQMMAGIAPQVKVLLDKWIPDHKVGGK